MRKFTPRFFLYLLILLIISFNFSCRKEYIHAPVTIDSMLQTGKVVQQFFNSHLPADENVIAVRNNILRQNTQKPFVDKFVKFAGYPIWDKAVVKVAEVKGATASKALKETSNGKVIFIPLALDTLQRVNAILEVKIAGNDTVFHVLYKWQYNRNGYKDNTKFNSANQTALLFMGLESYTFGHEDFKLNDTLLLRGKRISDTIHIESFNKNAAERATQLIQSTVTICYTVSCSPDTRERSNIVICPPECNDFMVWVDDGTGSGGGGGGTGSGGDSGGGGLQDDPCAPSGGSTGPSTRVGQLDPCDGGGSDPWLPVLPPPDDAGMQFDPNYPFANIDNPINVPDDPLISSSVSVTDNISIDDPTETPRTIAHTQNRKHTEDKLRE